MKRHQVMDMFYGSLLEEVGSWNSLNPLPTANTKVKVQLTDKTETFAYFYADKAGWVSLYGKEPCYFWECKSREPLKNVEAWKKLKEPVVTYQNDNQEDN